MYLTEEKIVTLNVIKKFCVQARNRPEKFCPNPARLKALMQGIRKMNWFYSYNLEMFVDPGFKILRGLTSASVSMYTGICFRDTV